MPRAVLFPNEYRELRDLLPVVETFASPDSVGAWVLTLSPADQERIAAEVERAVARAERQYQMLGRQIWLTRPQISDEDFARLDAQHGAAERRIRVLSRVLAALLDAGQQRPF